MIRAGLYPDGGTVQGAELRLALHQPGQLIPLGQPQAEQQRAKQHQQTEVLLETGQQGRAPNRPAPQPDGRCQRQFIRLSNRPTAQVSNKASVTTSGQGRAATLPAGLSKARQSAKLPGPASHRPANKMMSSGWLASRCASGETHSDSANSVTWKSFRPMRPDSPAGLAGRGNRA